jgi:hypothetical protein
MKTKILSAALAATALTSAQGAAAQQACVQAEDLSDTITYAMPAVYGAVQVPCSAIFAENEFMTNDAGAFVDQFRAMGDAAWPGTLRLLKVFMTSGENAGDGMAEAVAQMPDDALRPLVDVILTQMVEERLTKDMKVSTCSDIAEAMELIAPLPPENIAGLAAFLARQADLKNPQICGTGETSSTSAE